MQHILKTILLLVICISCLAHIVSCGLQVKAEELGKDLSPVAPQGASLTSDGKLAVYQFSVALMKQLRAEGNENVSPLSVMLALGMTQNGAGGQTKAQMEQVLGMSADTLNPFLYAYLSSLEGDEVLKVAQSIWFHENNLSVSDAFLQTNKDYYNAEMYAAPFDKTTLSDINRWVSHHTDDMIPKLLDQIDPSMVMFLLSAMAFDAKWESAYKKSDIQKDYPFIKADGSVHHVDMMVSEENIYLSSEDGAHGFLKFYKGGRYAFAGILPPENTTPDAYLASLDGAKLQDLLTTFHRGTKVEAGLPAFTFEMKIKLNEALQNMGMTDAFDGSVADFSGIGTAGGNLAIDEVLHSTFIDVGAEGTRAAAVTSVGIKCTSAGPMDSIAIYLNRPFIYAIMDTATGLPIFLGTVYTPETN